MRAVLLALAVLAAAPPARALSWRAGESVAVGGGNYRASDSEAGVGFGEGRWDVSARAKAFRVGGEFSGTAAEYSARLTHRLEHVTVAGRIGTLPPNAQRAAYHLAGGGAYLTFYGLRLGPEDPGMPAVAESTAASAGWSSLERRWVTRFGATYTSTNHHKESPLPRGPSFVVVQHSWQLSVSETVFDRLTVSLRNGHDRYNKALSRTDPQWYLWNVDNAGAPLAVRGWPNNHVGADLTFRSGAWTVRGGFTRINMEFDGLVVLAGGDVRWRGAGTGLEARAGWYQSHVRGGATRPAAALGLTYSWQPAGDPKGLGKP